MFLGTFITLPSDLPATITDYTSGLFGDLKPLIFLLVGLFLGIFLLETIMDLIGDKLEARQRWAEWYAGIESEASSRALRGYREHEVEAKKEELIEEA